MSDLMPCPFCGNPPEMVEWTASPVEIKCEACGVVIDGLRDEVIAAWNRRAPVSTPQQSAPEAVQSVVACARRVLSKFGADSDWSEWKDLADALREFDSAGQDQQSAQRASVDTEDAFAWAVFADNGNVIIWSKRRDVVEPVAAEYGKPIVPVIAHINAWGSAGSGAI